MKKIIKLTCKRNEWKVSLVDGHGFGLYGVKAPHRDEVWGRGRTQQEALREAAEHLKEELDWHTQTARELAKAFNAVNAEGTYRIVKVR